MAKKQHGQGWITGRGVFVINAVPDLIDQGLECRIVGGMDVWIKTLVQQVAFPDVPVDVITRREGQEKKACHQTQAKHKRPLPPGRPFPGEGLDQAQEEQKSKGVKGAEKEDMLADRPGPGHKKEGDE